MYPHVNGTITVGFGKEDSKDIDFFFSASDSLEDNKDAVYRLLNTILDIYLNSVKDNEMTQKLRMQLEIIFLDMIKGIGNIPLNPYTRSERQYKWRVCKMKINALNSQYGNWDKFINGENDEFVNIVIIEEFI